MACEKCADLCLEYEIHSPSDLHKAFAVARDNIADGTIREISAQSFWGAASALDEGGSWPSDHLFYQFECRRCGERFDLYAETYHGRGGAWVQTCNSPEAKLKARIIGESPSQADDGLNKQEWFSPKQIGIVLTVLVVCSVLLFLYLRS